MSYGASTSKSLSNSDTIDYCAEFEWPGNEGPQDLLSPVSESPVVPNTRSPHYPVAYNSGFLRLTVLSSSVLPRKAVALIDSFDEVSIGRDRCATPRLRLKELAVSKYHANIYWDSQNERWSLVDVGSTHGTHLVSPDSPAAKASGSISSQGYPITELTRLASPKTSSLPRVLSHLQHIIIGNTTLVVHMHEDRTPCDACAVTQQNMLHLDAPTKPKATVTHNGVGLNATESMRALKQNLLSRPSYSGSDTRPTQAPEIYTDRAQLRRQRFPGWREPQPHREPDAPQRISTRPYPRTQLQRTTQASGSTERKIESGAPSPIPLDNVGHKLLKKQGWVPGSALGTQSETGKGPLGLIEPLVPQSTTNRRGLGMHQP
ncbi:hypothetical protein B0J17DRAFT_625820 [Rhizoctonia solani]|nr:hypothetical protein B0J17DRAFT_625820 [Rhizoctonia solani]